jgi:predicted house-cleaning noncanonical NTP pyrophosphatase (MazG superfamily)
MMGAVSDIVSKLVRDRIPEIMRAQGKSPEVERVDGERLRSALKDKLVEEAVELREAGDICEELADVLEVADALIEAYGINPNDVAALRQKKCAERGGFEQGYYLK